MAKLVLAGLKRGDFCHCGARVLSIGRAKRDFDIDLTSDWIAVFILGWSELPFLNRLYGLVAKTVARISEDANIFGSPLFCHGDLQEHGSRLNLCVPCFLGEIGIGTIFTGRL